MSPGALHYGMSVAIREKRIQTLETAYFEHPERFVKKIPTPPEIPEAVWINPPKTQDNEKRPENNNKQGSEVIAVPDR
jgi:putative transposase